MFALLLFAIGSVGIGFAAVVYRADPSRADNRLFALIAGIDAVTAFARALLVSQGYALSDPIVLRIMTVLSVAIAVATLELTYGFPGGRRLPTWARWLNLFAGVFGASFAFVLPDRTTLVAELYFFPAFTLTLFFLWRNFRRLGGGAGSTSVKLVMLALALRWTMAQIAYDVAIAFDPAVFRAFLTCEATVAVLVSQTLIGYAVVVGHLFRVRGFLAEVMVMGSFALAVVVLTGSLINLALDLHASPIGQHLLLFVAALVPLALHTAARRFRGGLESALLGPLDPRRATRESCLEAYMQKAERADVPTLLAVARDALAAMTLGGKVRYLSLRPLEGSDGPLDEAVVSALAPVKICLHTPGGPLHTPVRVVGELAGAFVVEGGQIDRDSVLTAVTISKHVGLRMENLGLVAELEESKRLAALGAFAAAIAHDIRTPLTSVQMNVQILRKKVSLPPDDMEHFDIALDEVKRLGAHVAELLDYAKPIRVEPVAMPARELADEAARYFAEREVNVVVEDEGAPAVLADPTRIRQVLLNLLDNAAHASSPGATITVKVCEAPEARVAFEVADSGKGIEPAHLARIFEPFFTTRPDGTGLGLAIVQKLVRAHRGEVSARSTLGQGTTVTVLLPAVT